MPSLSDYAQNQLLDALMRGAPFVVPSTWYVALVTTAGASNALAGVEVTGGSYARVPVQASLAAWAGTQGDGSTGISIGSGGHTSNNAPIVFPKPTANWGEILGYEFWDAARNGHRWLYDRLVIPKTVSLGDPQVTFPAGDLGLTFV